MCISPMAGTSRISGIYEMVRRRCRYIVVCDAGCDPRFTYEDLGNALRKIRIDMKIPIDFDGSSFQSLGKKRCSVATSAIAWQVRDEDGYLLYIKPMICGNEPPDVLSYQTDHKSFPHQSTAKQFFDESQTESYRMLGLFTATKSAGLGQLRRDSGAVSTCRRRDRGAAPCRRAVRPR